MELAVKHIELDTTESTHTYLRNFQVAENELIAVSARFQTNGHGQKGNSWESERGKNLILSFAFRAPFVPPAQQFLLSQALSLGLRDTVGHFLPEKDKVHIKWPNDLYYEDRKLCGFLVTCDLENGIIGRCMAGIGLNVNQEHFLSDAPNPVSMKQVLHRDTPVEKVRTQLLSDFLHHYDCLREKKYALIESAYLQALYHRDGFYLYKDRNGMFRAEITGVSPQGILFLRDEGGKERSYAFKEVVQLPAELKA